jgi:cytochrome c-type biogenesis protein
MDIEALRSTLEQVNVASLAIGLAIGFVFSFNPVALAAIPVSLAYMTKAHAPQRTALLGSMFVLGMIVTHAMLGLIVGLGGGWIQRFIGRE